MTLFICHILIVIFPNHFHIVHTDETSKDAEYKLAQSGDATCNGLDSAEVRK